MQISILLSRTPEMATAFQSAERYYRTAPPAEVDVPVVLRIHRFESSDAGKKRRHSSFRNTTLEQLLTKLAILMT